MRLIRCALRAMRDSDLAGVLGRVPVQRVERGDDRVQRVPKIVPENSEVHVARALALPFRGLERRDVARDLGGADDVPALVVDRRHRQGDIDDPPVLRLSQRLVVLDALAPPDAVEDGEEVVLLLGREDQLDGFSDRLVGRVPEDPLGGTVPAGDRAVEGLGDDRVLARADDRGEQAPLLVGLLAVRDVRAEARHAGRAFRRASRPRRGPRSTRCRRPAGRPELDLVARALVERAPDRRLDVRAILGVHEIQERLDRFRRTSPSGARGPRRGCRTR